MDKSICFTICPIGFIAWVVVMFLAAFWNYAAHDKVKDFEEYHGLNGYRYSTDNYSNDSHLNLAETSFLHNKKVEK